MTFGVLILKIWNYLSKLKYKIELLLCVISIFSKHAWVVPLRDKEGIANTNIFQKIVDKFGCKPNKI